MNPLTLRQRLLFLALIPSTLLAISLVTYFTFSGVRSLETELHSNGEATVRYLAPISEYGIIAGNNEGLYSLVQATLQQPGVKAAIVVNRKGRTIAVSGRVSLAAETLGRTLNAATRVEETDRWVAFGAPVIRSKIELDPIFESIAPTEVDAHEVIGHVFIELDKTELRQGQRIIMQRGLAIIAAGLIIVYLLASRMSDTLAQPLLRLVGAVRSMSQSDFSTRVAHVSTGEIGELESGFNDMAKHIQAAHQSMQERIEEATAQLAFQARHDALTGLLNRREFELRLQKALETIQAGAEEASFLFIDLDRFKPVNDSCGHLAGDELLRQIAQLLQGRLREGDTLARLGGDEFGILLANCSGTAARQVADDICNLASAYRFIWQDKVFAVGASIGLTGINQRVRNINDILGAADAACYAAKEAGRNQVAEQATVTITERRQEPGDWPTRIMSALEEGRLLVDAHPICCLKGEHDIHRVELAARLNEPGQGNVSLDALIDAAERYDLSPRIDRLLLETAISTLARTRRLGKTVHCLVPISATSLNQAETVNFIAEALARDNIDGSGLHLVFSEEIASRHIGQAMLLIRNLKALGCEIVLDEFGGSMSSFSHLRNLSPYCIKLSRSLTRDLTGNRASTALLRAIIEITEDLDIITIADGIENPREFNELSVLGIHCAQGHAVGPTEPFASWLEGAVVRGAG